MRKSKLTLVVDGNWLLMSRLAVIIDRYASTTELMKDLKLMMIKSINIVLKTFPKIDNVIFVADGGSWRNQIIPPDFLKDKGIEYKGNREKTDDVDWDGIFNEYEDFINTLKESGITVCREHGLEGDDWCCWWSNHLNEEGTNVIIWSKDKDLTQLVKTDSEGCFTICWNKDGLTCQSKEDDDDVNFLFNSEYSENSSLFNSIVLKSNAVNVIDPAKIMIDKIIRGDAGDNILPIIIRKSKNESSTRQFKVSSKDIDTTINIFDDNAVKLYIYDLCNRKSYKGRIDKTPEQVYEHFLYNRNLVVLNKDMWPDYIIDSLKNYEDYNCGKDLSIAESKISKQHAGLDNVLDFI